MNNNDITPVETLLPTHEQMNAWDEADTVIAPTQTHTQQISSWHPLMFVMEIAMLPLVLMKELLNALCKLSPAPRHLTKSFITGTFGLLMSIALWCSGGVLQMINAPILLLLSLCTLFPVAHLCLTTLFKEAAHVAQRKLSG